MKGKRSMASPAQKLPPAWISLRDAGKVVATVFFSRNVPIDLYDGNYPEEVSDTRHALMDALMSGRVKCLLSSEGYHTHQPNSEVLDHFASGIDFAAEVMTLGATPGVFWNVKVHRYDLLDFMKRQRDERSPMTVAEADAACTEWLIDQMERDVDEKRPYFSAMAKRKFGTVDARFDAVWKRAIEVTGKTGYSAPGRPRNRPIIQGTT
jgi:hypothetical protein